MSYVRRIRVLFGIVFATLAAAGIAVIADSFDYVNVARGFGFVVVAGVIAGFLWMVLAFVSLLRLRGEVGIGGPVKGVRGRLIEAIRTLSKY